MRSRPSVLPVCAVFIFGAYDPKGGGIEHGPRFFAQPTCHHKPEVVGGVEEQKAGELLKKFFADKR